MDKKEIEIVLAAHGLTMESTFIPFSKSRNKAEKNRSMNWEVTIKCNGRHVLATDYDAGIAHCPSYNQPVPAWFSRHYSYWNHYATNFETEFGCKYNRNENKSATKIAPDFVDVMYSLTADSGVLDQGDFETWADNYGYDHDSRSAEKMYKICLENALKLRAALGEAGLTALREAYQDY